MAISDTHFGHDEIRQYCDRPFGSVRDMDGYMIRQWNHMVGDDDIIVHVGDLSFHSKSELQSILELLDGRMMLVLGNHDKFTKSFYLRYFDMVMDEFRFGNYIFTHIPMREVPDGMFNVHGHIHNLRATEVVAGKVVEKHPPAGDPRWINVSAEVTDYAPVVIWKGGSVESQEKVSAHIGSPR